MRTRAGRLLHFAIASGDITREQITRDFCLVPNDVDKILAGTSALSLAHQRCLATLLIERVPKLARQGHALRAQVDAAIAFSECRTQVHSHAPHTWHTLQRSSGRPRKVSVRRSL